MDNTNLGMLFLGIAGLAVLAIQLAFLWLVWDTLLEIRTYFRRRNAERHDTRN